MGFLTGLALRRRSVTVLLVIMVLVGGLITYRSLPVELFPEIEFPLITISAFYPSANPEAVVRDVAAPIEKAVSGVDGLDNVLTISTEDRLIALASFTFGTDMAEAERTILGNIRGIAFPNAVAEPRVGRITPDEFPVIQLSVVSDRDLAELQPIVQSQVIPAVSAVKGVSDIDLVGSAERQVFISADPEKLLSNGVSLAQVAGAIRNNQVNVPAGAISQEGRTFTVRTSHTYASVDELLDLIVGTSAGDDEEPSPVKLSDVADVSMGAGPASSISRTNGKPSLGIAVVKDPEANTVEVTKGVLDAIEALQGLPGDMEFVTISNDGPQIQGQVDTLQREALFGFLFAIVVVFLFLLTVRPSVLKGLQLTIRPTIVIALSIPLSIFAGLLIMGARDMTLNLMTLGGLAISVGRVVDDSIVVLENVYRHIQRGEDRFEAALEATKEVAPAIVASTLTTIVVFVPLAFIQGLVGAFFRPFALTVSFALVASLLVALTAVPVLGAILVRPGDLRKPDSDVRVPDRETWMQRAYTPVLLWALRHKAATLFGALLITVASLGLIAIIPITLFPSEGERFLTVAIALRPDSSMEKTFAEVGRVEDVMATLTREGSVEVYMTTIGSPESFFDPGATGRPGGASVFVRLTETAPDDIAETLRRQLNGGNDEGSVTVAELSGGPPSSGLELNVTGNDYGQIAAVARQLVNDIGTLEGIVNVSSDVTEARDEVVITADPSRTADLGLTAADVARQVNQFMVGQTVTQVEVDGVPTEVFLRGSVDPDGGIEALKLLQITGPLGAAPLADVSDVTIEESAVSITRTDGRRSASITGSITSEDTQAVGMRVQEKIDALNLPPGVKVTTGGIFQDIAEGFQAIFLAMATGIILVYLVMVASLGGLRNPFVIVMSLPLALIGALVALAVTGRTLGLPALMGLLLLIGIVVTNAIVLIAFVEQLRERGLGVHEALIQGGRVRLRPILMTAFTTSIALLPLAAFVSEEGALIGAELATVVIGGLISSTFLTLLVVPVVYTIMHTSVPGVLAAAGRRIRRTPMVVSAPAGNDG